MKARDKEEEIFLKNLGARISAIRTAKPMTQVELGYRCDMEKSNMRRIEAGNSNPTALTLKKICAALDITLQELFTDLPTS